MLEGDRGPDLVIGSGATESNVIKAIALRGAKYIIIGAPGTLPETVNPQIDLGGTYFKLRSNGTTIAFAAGCADAIAVADFENLKLVATGATAAERTFKTRIISEITS